MKAYEIIHEDGSIDYANNTLMSNQKSGPEGPIKQVQTREFEATPAELHAKMAASRFMVAEKQSDQYEIRERSLNEMVSKGMLPEREAERIFQDRQAEARGDAPNRGINK